MSQGLVLKTVRRLLDFVPAGEGLGRRSTHMESSTLSYTPPTRTDPSTNNLPVREGGKPRHWPALAWWLTQTHPSRQKVASGSGAVDGRPFVSGLALGLAPERVTCRKLG